MLKMRYFDLVQRRHDKARARAADDLALQSGVISRADLQAQNSFLASLDIVGSSSEHQSAYL